MAQTEKIQPNVPFIKELQAAGGDSLKQCYQCATCSVACPISPKSNPYPRKEMIWAQWGLKDKLLADPDVWLCYNCGNCADLCPRGAKPADLMSALRNMAYRRLVTPSVIGEWMSSPKHLSKLIALPAVLFALIWAFMYSINFQGNFNDGIFPTGTIIFGKIFYGDYTIDPLFIAVVGFVLFSLFKGTKNLIESLKPEGTTLMLGRRKSVIRCLMEVVFGEVLTHSRFTECGNDCEKSSRKLGHMTLMFGFIALVIVTAYIAFGHWVGRIPGLEFIYVDTPLPFLHPMKLLANLGMLLLLVGLSLLTLRRRTLSPSKQTSNYYDWYLLGVIWVVAVTGMFCQFLRLADFKTLAYMVYYLHLISVFMLFAYLPWSKLGHLVYRTAVLTYVRYLGRK